MSSIETFDSCLMLKNICAVSGSQVSPNNVRIYFCDTERLKQDVEAIKTKSIE